MGKKKLIYGVGINDAGYKISIREASSKVDGVRVQRTIWLCPYYEKWRGMLKRCYSDKSLEKHPSYRGCTVYPAWLTFSNFRKWMILQDWQSKGLDKDLLVEGKKEYSPETCVFIHHKVNSFVSISGRGRGDHLLGMYYSERTNSFVGRVRSPFGGRKQIVLGAFPTELEAHFAWKKEKHRFSCLLANSEFVTDGRVRQVLLTRYQNYTVLEDHLK